MGDRMVRVQVGEPSRRTQGLQEVRRGRLTPAPNRGRNLNVPPVAYLPPIEEPEEIEMGVIGLERFDGAIGARRRSGGNQSGGDINLRRGNSTIDIRNTERLETCGARDLTIVQAWTMFGYGTLTLPAYVSYDAEGDVYVLKSNIIQKMFCVLQHGCSIVDAAMNLALIPAVINTNPSPATFIRISGTVVEVLLSAWFFKVTFMNMHPLLSYHNAMIMDDENRQNDIPINNAEVERIQPKRNSGRSKMRAMFFLVAAGGFIIFMIGIDTAILLNAYDGNWRQRGGPNIIQAFSCYARMAYTWKNYETCGSDIVAAKYSLLPYEDILWSIPGLVTFFTAKLALYQKFLGIDATNLAFYDDAQNANEEIEVQNAPVGRTYEHLKSRTELLSSFAGLLLMMQLLATGLTIPDWSMALLLKDIPLTVYIFAMFLGFFCFLLLGCYGALLADKIKGELTGPRGRHEMPFARRELAAFVVNVLFGKVGIGFFGIFVLNFGTLLTYMSTVGTWIAVLYDAEHGH